VIEIVSEARCVACNICVKICPADVFDSVCAAAPLIARQDDCQTCFLCELYCPVDALFVDAQAEHAPDVREADVEAEGLFGSYARSMGWSRGKPGGADRDPTFHIRAAMPA
jgi:NAD-dependent dihydropyrimidine dehydrogenase PreA subunit